MVRSSDATVVLAKIPTKITITVSPTTGVPPIDITVRGRLTWDGNGIDGKTIWLVVNDARVTSTLTVSDWIDHIAQVPGWYNFLLHLTEPGTYTIHVEFDGDATYEGCELESSVVMEEKISPPISLWKVAAVFFAVLGAGGAGYAIYRRRRK